jgi:twinkle protein
MGINGVVFDPWNMIDPTRKSGITETEHIRDSLESFKAFGRDYNVAVYIVAHPNKPLKEPGGKIPVPNAYDISGSAHWYNIVDNIISVWRNPEELSTPVQIHIQKVRFGEVGTSGTSVELEFNRATGIYTDTSKPIIVPKKKEETVGEMQKRLGDG